MRKGYQRQLFLLSMVFLLLFSTGVQAEEKLEFDLTRPVLVNRLKNVLIGNDINTIRRNLIDRRFSPLHAMASYRELLLWSRKAAKNDPFWNDVVAMVREGMVATIRDSRMGIPLSGWKGEGKPVSVVYLNSYPAYQEVPDFNDLTTLRWREGMFANVVTPGSIGLSLTAKTLLISMDQSQAGKKQAPLMLASALQELDILTQQLFIKKRLVSIQTAGGEKKIQGKESERGVKMLLAPMPKALSKSSEKKVLKNALGPIDEDTYVPDQIRIPMEQKGWQVSQDVSRLSSQASLLEGLLYLHELLTDDALIKPHIVNGKIEGRELADWRALVRRAIDVVYTTITVKHFDTAQGSFAGTYQPKKGIANRIVIIEINRAVNVLEKLAAVFPNDADLQKSVNEQILSQAAFLEKAQANKTGIPRGYMLKNGAHITGLMREFSNAISYISIMLAAENVAGDGRYRDLAKKYFDAAHKVFWSEVAKVYRLSAGLKVSTYTGVSFAVAMEWLRKMGAMLPDTLDAQGRAKDYIDVVLKESGLLQSEGPATGEVHQPEYYIENEVDALYTRLKEGGVNQLGVSIEKYISHVSDQDGDGIFGVRFSGNKTGGAPVITMQVGVITPIITSGGTSIQGEMQRNYGF